jgi:hypothetical protein
MVFTELVPQDRRPYLSCKRRSCPHQKLFEQKQLNGNPPKYYFTYQCDNFEIWCLCRRQIEPTATANKPMQKEPKQEEQPQQKPKLLCGYPDKCYTCNVKDKCPLQQQQEQPQQGDQSTPANAPELTELKKRKPKRVDHTDKNKVIESLGEQLIKLADLMEKSEGAELQKIKAEYDKVAKAYIDAKQELSALAGGSD